MPHSLTHKLTILRRRARRYGMLYAVGVGATGVLAGVMLLGLTDFLVHLEDRGLRVMATLLAVGLFAWACCRYLYPAWNARWTDLDLARRLEQRFPSLRHKLVDAVEFQSLSDADSVNGSVLLRLAVIAEATAETEPLDFSEVLDIRWPLRTLAGLAMACLLASYCVMIAPSASRTAITRLFNPFSQVRWPQENHLEIRGAVDRVAKGQPFELAVVDAEGATLPDEVFVHYRFGGKKGDAAARTERMMFSDGVMTTRLDSVARSFSYRVEGGDDTSMPWRKVEVVEPPAVESLDIRLIPPAYSGCRPQRSDRHIVALVGTRMEMSGRATGPIASATLCFEDGRRFPGSLDSDGCGFRLPAGGESVLVEKSETYWLELTDREGIRGGEDRWGIDAVPDLPSTVAIQQPTANIAVTSRAVAAVRVAAWDDLALKRVEIVFRRSPSASEERLPLYVGPETAPARTSIPTVSSSGASGQARDGRRVFQHRWELESLDLQPGSQISYWATATDYHLQTAKSDTRQLTILSLQEFEERVAAREKIIAAELERALKMQRACRAQADALVAQLAAERPMEAIDVDRVRSLQMVQRDASSVLTSSGEGLPMHVRGLLVDLENNRVDLGDTLNRLQTLSHDLDRIAAEMLTPIAQELTLATKTIQIDLEGRDKSLSPDSEVVALLRRVGGRQDSVIAALAQLLEPLTRWEDYRRFDGEWANLVREQEKLAGQTVDLGRRTLTRDRQDLPAQDANDLEKTASRQIELAQTLVRLLQGMEKASLAMPTNDPLAASVADAVSTAERLGLEERMRASAAQLGQNQMGQAIAGQGRIVADLQDVADRLAGGARKRSGRMDETLKALQRRQQELLTETKRLRGVEQSATGLGRAELLAIRELTRQQQALGADTAQFSASVPDSDNLRSILGIAGQSMQKAESLLAKRNVGDATAEAETDALRQLAAVADLMAELARRSDAATRSAKPGEAEERADRSPSASPQTGEQGRDERPEQQTDQQTAKKDEKRDGSASPTTPGESVPSDRGRQGRVAEWKAMQDRMRRLWGELPQHARQQMLQSPTEQAPPKYEEAIEEYFRRLSEGKP